MRALKRFLSRWACQHETLGGAETVYYRNTAGGQGIAFVAECLGCGQSFEGSHISADKRLMDPHIVIGRKLRDQL